MELEYGGTPEEEQYYSSLQNPGGEYHNSMYKRRDIVTISKIPYFKHVEENKEDKNMRDINIIDLKK